jgi:regulatory protein
VAQKWRERRAPPPLDAERLDRIALRYVERYATTRAKLAAYLERKLRERGWAGDAAPDVAGLVERFAELRYVDDETFAATRTASLMRRGYGPRRVTASLRAAGVEDAGVRDDDRAVWEAALAFARRKRIGPFAAVEPDRAGREKAFAAMMRAGHDPALARRIAYAAPDQVPTWDEG